MSSLVYSLMILLLFMSQSVAARQPTEVRFPLFGVNEKTLLCGYVSFQSSDHSDVSSSNQTQIPFVSPSNSSVELRLLHDQTANQTEVQNLTDVGDFCFSMCEM